MTKIHEYHKEKDRIQEQLTYLTNKMIEVVKKENQETEEELKQKAINIIKFVYADLEEKEINQLIEEAEANNNQILIAFYKAYKNTDFENLKIERIKGNKYCYNITNLEITEELRKELETLQKQEHLIFLENIDGEIVFS